MEEVRIRCTQCGSIIEETEDELCVNCGKYYKFKELYLLEDWSWWPNAPVRTVTRRRKCPA